MTTEHQSSAIASADGTRISFGVHGPDDAQTILWVHGATMFRALNDVPARFAAATGLRLVEYDRRGRGDSGDTAPYALE